MENKNYLTWKDLDFDEYAHHIIDVKLNGNLYIVEYYINELGMEQVEIYKNIDGKIYPFNWVGRVERTLFNDLKLEVVE